jgi:hypothetical protein
MAGSKGVKGDRCRLNCQYCRQKKPNCPGSALRGHLSNRRGHGNLLSDRRGHSDALPADVTPENIARQPPEPVAARRDLIVHDGDLARGRRSSAVWVMMKFLDANCEKDEVSLSVT